VISEKSSVPYNYFQLPVCDPPEAGRKIKAESLGEVIIGDRLRVTGYQLNMLVNTTCTKLCTTENPSVKEFTFLKQMVQGEFMVEWLNLIFELYQ
jgi:hypothetical protein